ncbi:MAG: hypothetical protein LBT51_09630 [Fusobacteriaceae bacterium]|nr:hypothetical protein [Fusobacteriaceae bacterium]
MIGKSSKGYATLLEPKKNVIFVLTKCDVARDDQINALVNTLRNDCESKDENIYKVCDSEGM